MSESEVDEIESDDLANCSIYELLDIFKIKADSTETLAESNTDDIT